MTKFIGQPFKVGSSIEDSLIPLKRSLLILHIFIVSSTAECNALLLQVDKENNNFGGNETMLIVDYYSFLSVQAAFKKYIHRTR